MEQFCAELQSERTRNGASLEEIARVTRVPERHLLALEEGRFAELPGGIFRKGILRSYLQAIAVDPAPWLPRFEASLAAMELADPILGLPEVAATVDRARGGGQPTAPPASVSRAPFPASASAAPPQTHRWSGVVVAVALLLAFGWCVWRFALHGRVVLSFAAPASSLPAGRPVTSLNPTVPLTLSTTWTDRR